LSGLIKKRVLFLVAFGFSKATVFFAPLLLSNVLTLQNLGILEYAMNIGFVGAAILNLGVPNAYPYFKLKRGFKTIFQGFNFHLLYVLVTSIIVVGYVLLFNNDEKLVLSILFIYNLSNQGFYSMRYKTNEIIVKAVIIDALFYVVLASSYLYMYFYGNTSIHVILIFSIFYSCCFAGIALFKQDWINLRANFKKHQKLIKYGKSVMVSGFLILLIANSGKIILEFILKDIELVGIFSFYFRMASFVVIIHQVLNIIYFRRIYTFSIKKLDSYFAAFLLIIATGAIVTFYLVPIIGEPYFVLFKTFQEYKDIYLILCFQMVFWIILANNENVIYREKLAAKMNIGFIISIGVFAILVGLLKSTLNFLIVVKFLYIFVVISVYIQFFILYKYKRIVLRKTIFISSCVFIISLLTILI